MMHRMRAPRSRLGWFLAAAWTLFVAASNNHVLVHAFLSRNLLGVHSRNDFSFDHLRCCSKSLTVRSAVESTEAAAAASNKKETAFSTPPTSTTTARFLAVQALMPKGKGGASFAVERFEQLPGFDKLALRDRSFGRLLLTTTERRLGQIDCVLQACEQHKPTTTNSKRRQRPPSRIDALVTAVLRIGAVQLLFLHVPAHAAVKETVDVLRMHAPWIKVPESRIKYVNAVLRRVSREGETLLATTQVSDNCAPWLLSEWQSAWGLQRTDQILQAAMEESPRYLTIRNDPSGQRTLPEQTEWVASHFSSVQPCPNGSLKIVTPPPGPISSWPLYQEGCWWLQDVSATLPALALLSGLESKHGSDLEGLSVVDLCAAPGGKTAQLANTHGKQLNVTAVEVSAQRSKRLRENQQRLGLEWTTVVADGTKWTPDRPVAGVLLDAPCTATGTASRRPDVLWRNADDQDLLQVQYDLACHASDHLLQADGGILVYATCSLLKQESEDQVKKLLSRQEQEGCATLETLPFEIGEIPGFDSAIDENGWLRVLPGSSLSDSGLEQCDGFFVARLQRIR